MQFKVLKQENPLLHHYDSLEIEIAQKFTNILREELQEFMQSLILFGSTARMTRNKDSDIDILVITDDNNFVMTKPLTETYKLVLQKAINLTDDRIHVTTMTLSSFFEYAKEGDPVAVNILRDGIAMFDGGVFEPLQLLHRKGKIRPTIESVWKYFSKAPKTLTNSKWHVTQAALDLYWAVIDSAHAALMIKKSVPPMPSKVSEMMIKSYGKDVPTKYIKTIDKFYDLQKKIISRKLDYISGKDFDKLYEEAESFVKYMNKILDKAIYNKKI